MAAVTFLQMTNRVLQRLRQNQLSTLVGATSYPSLIAGFVNDAIEEVENAWQWNCLNVTIPVTSVSGTGTYSVTGSGQDFVLKYIFDTYNNVRMLGPMTNIFLDTGLITKINTPHTPIYFDFAGQDANGDLQVRFFPIPDASGRVFNVFGRVKQGYLNTSTDGNTLIKVPYLPVMYLALAKAIAERGEDGGSSYQDALIQYTKVLGDSIAIDQALNHTNTDWWPA